MLVQSTKILQIQCHSLGLLDVAEGLTAYAIENRLNYSLMYNMLLLFPILETYVMLI